MPDRDDMFTVAACSEIQVAYYRMMIAIIYESFDCVPTIHIFVYMYEYYYLFIAYLIDGLISG